jgi:hypothetical protein
LRAAGGALGIFTPTMGHWIYRRIVFTRGLVLRLIVGLAGFVTGAILDLIDSARAVDGDRESSNTRAL